MPREPEAGLDDFDHGLRHRLRALAEVVLVEKEADDCQDHIVPWRKPGLHDFTAGLGIPPVLGGSGVHTRVAQPLLGVAHSDFLVG